MLHLPNGISVGLNAIASVPSEEVSSGASCAPSNKRILLLETGSSSAAGSDKTSDQLLA